MQNFSWKTALDKLPVALRTTWASLHCWMLGCGSSTTMCLLVMMSGSLGTLGTMTCRLVLFGILAQWLWLLVDTRISRGINDKIVHFLLGDTTKQMSLLIQKITRVGSRNCSLGDSRGCVSLFCRTRNTAAYSHWLCLRSIDWIWNASGCICSRGRLTHNDSTTNLWNSKKVSRRRTWRIGIHCPCIVDQDVVYVDPRWTNRARNAWCTSSSNCTLMLDLMLLLVFLHLSSCLVAWTCSNIDIAC